MEVLKKIDLLRQERGWSIYRLAQEAGLTQSTVSNMYARKTIPSIQTLESICSAFEITLSQFFSEGEGSEVLNEKEKKLISQYRQLDEQKKKAVSDLVDSLSH
jgi:transcriptional regulator with XRE-family HTH domain